jgi:TetR/AcrR family transcriptional regulator
VTGRRTRDPADKKRRIVDAALVEFAERGPAAARTADIAAAAGVNKQLIYHYFGSKDGLWSHVLERFAERFDEAADDVPEALAERLSLFFVQSNHDRSFTRLLEWEARASERAAQLQEFVGTLNDDIENGRLDPGADPEQLALTIIAAAAFAQAFPQFVRLLLGMAPDDPRFVASRSRHLAWLGEQLAPRLGTVHGTSPVTRRGAARPSTG